MTHYEYSLINTFYTKIKYNFHHNNLQFSIDVPTLSQISIFAVKYLIFNEYACLFQLNLMFAVTSNKFSNIRWFDQLLSLSFFHVNIIFRGIAHCEPVQVLLFRFQGISQFRDEWLGLRLQSELRTKLVILRQNLISL